MHESTLPPPEPSIADALGRLIEAGQRVVSDRADLIRLDLAQAALIALRGVALIATGAVFLGGAWIVLLIGIAVWLGEHTTLPIALLTVALSSAGFGAAAVAVGIGRARRRAVERLVNLGVVSLDGAQSAEAR